MSKSKKVTKQRFRTGELVLITKGPYRDSPGNIYRAGCGGYFIKLLRGSMVLVRRDEITRIRVK